MSTRRRALLTGATAALVASAAPAVAAGNDAELIRRCYEFAERELDHWYQYVMAPDDVADSLDWPTEWETVRRITETPATTPAGWHAKALALTAWDRSIYDDEPDERTAASTMLAALLRDMLAPTRNAIIARLRRKYGPLPDTYTPEGIWMGSAEA